MSDEAKPGSLLHPRRVAVATAVVLCVAAMAVVAYLLLDVVMLVFLGVVLAAALQPLHVRLHEWGVPRSPSVVLVYLLPIVGLALAVLVVVPVLSEQIGNFLADVPQSYGELRTSLRESDFRWLEVMGEHLPSRESMAPVLSGLMPAVAEGTLGVTTAIVMLPVYFLTVLAVGFYWTIELPQFERLVLSMVDVERRPAALNVWHEIEFRLGGYLRGQALAMLFIGTASGLGYALIGLPNALVLGLLAGVLEAVPFVGPTAALVPAVLVALPLGTQSVLLVFGLAALLQTFESDVLVPRIMEKAVGVSALVSIVSLLAFAQLYGMLGVLIAIPVAAVIQVVLDTTVLHPAAPAAHETLDEPRRNLRARLAALQEHARERLRARTNRMGIDPATADHVVDAMDQQIELALAHLARAIEQSDPASAKRLAPSAEARCVSRLQSATRHVEQAIERAEEHDSPLPESCLHELEQALERFRDTVDEVEAALVVTQERTDRRSGPVVLRSSARR